MRSWINGRAVDWTPEEVAARAAETKAARAQHYAPGEELLVGLKAAKLAELSYRRWASEVGGTTFNGMPVRTDRETSGVLTAAVVKTILNPAFTIPNWKLPDGSFITLNAAAIGALAQVVSGHVQATFDNEATLASAIEAASDEDALDAVDLETGWP